MGWRITLLLCAAALWFLANATPEFELPTLALGGLTLAAALWAARRGRRLWIYRLCALTFAGALMVAGLEALLVCCPGLVRGELANYVYTAGNCDPDGIYERDPNLALRMRPNFACRTYFNGYWWRHDANARGYRGALLDHADAVFLGDSMVYGHGVETDQTVPACFARRTGHSAANLGLQGIMAIQYALMLERVGLDLHPRYVLVCCHPNDIPEATSFYSIAELQRYLATPPTAPCLPQVQAPWRGGAWRDCALNRFYRRHFTWQLRTGRLVRGIYLLLSRPRGPREPAAAAAEARAAASCAPPEWAIHEPFHPLAPDAPEAVRLGWLANVQALKRIKAHCDALGARMILFDMGRPVDHTRMIEQVARELGADYSAAGTVVLNQALAGRPVYLAHDGHWSPEGCEAIARELAKMVEAEPTTRP